MNMFVFFYAEHFLGENIKLTLMEAQYLARF